VNGSRDDLDRRLRQAMHGGAGELSGARPSAESRRALLGELHRRQAQRVRTAGVVGGLCAVLVAAALVVTLQGSGSPTRTHSLSLGQPRAAHPGVSAPVPSLPSQTHGLGHVQSPTGQSPTVQSPTPGAAASPFAPQSGAAGPAQVRPSQATGVAPNGAQAAAPPTNTQQCVTMQVGTTAPTCVGAIVTAGRAPPPGSPVRVSVGSTVTVSLPPVAPLVWATPAQTGVPLVVVSASSDATTGSARAILRSARAGTTKLSAAARCPATDRECGTAGETWTVEVVAR